MLLNIIKPSPPAAKWPAGLFSVFSFLCVCQAFGMSESVMLWVTLIKWPHAPLFCFGLMVNMDQLVIVAIFITFLSICGIY